MAPKSIENRVTRSNSSVAVLDERSGVVPDDGVAIKQKRNAARNIYCGVKMNTDEQLCSKMYGEYTLTRQIGLEEILFPTITTNA